MVEPGRFPGRVDAESVSEYLDTLNKLALDLEVPLWDTYSIDWEEAMFADEVHFNRQGTEAFTAYFQELLESLDY
jgi:hypothetical protein